MLQAGEGLRLFVIDPGPRWALVFGVSRRWPQNYIIIHILGYNSENTENKIRPKIQDSESMRLGYEHLLELGEIDDKVRSGAGDLPIVPRGHFLKSLTTAFKHLAGVSSSAAYLPGVYLAIWESHWRVIFIHDLPGYSADNG